MPHHKIDMAGQMREAKALELRVAGHSWEEVARLAGYTTKSNAFKAANSLLKKNVAEDVETYRALEDMRLDKLWQAVYPLAVGYTETTVDDDGEPCIVVHPVDMAAVDRAVKIAERRSRLQGLDIKPDKDDIPASVVLIREVVAPLDKL
jgi:hypothetical protein